MIKYVTGNLLEAPTEALVNMVNEVGVMGKGIALMFREAFPDNTAAYIRACEAKQVHVGHMFVTENKELVQPRWIINFPTKKHWRGDSQIEWIHDGLRDLVRVIREKSFAPLLFPLSGAATVAWTGPMCVRKSKPL
jgi:O-acetyl-ADP-ribose deacetylase (regulator of RNase III)